MSDTARVTFEKMKMGFIMGGTTGMAVGFLVGSMTVLRTGPGEKGYLATVGGQMLQTGAFLGFIMSIGMLLRNDSEEMKGMPPPRPMWQPQNKTRPFALYPNRLPIVIEQLK
ncbi:subunit of TIM23 translocase complex [Blyttiomyces sp. JEL0837]|nr:subunit of TIM23 translocase complex [Blyttiomyces sp. JEL0837]